MSTQQSNDNRQILEEASTWFVDFRSSEIDKAKRRDFMQWLKRSPEHIRAYMEISGAYARLPSSAAVQDADVKRLVERARSRVNIASLPSSNETSRVASLAHQRRQSPKARRHPMRLAASIAVLCVCAASVGWLVFNRAPVYATQAAEQRSITLEDGSRIELNARSRVRVSLTPAQRRVELLEGQALFQVAEDRQRPFIVSSGGAQVRAVGTRFDVQRTKSGTTVTVLEGRVAIQSPLTRRGGGDDAAAIAAEQRSGVLELTAGEQAVITATAIARPRRANIAAATAWVRGELEFDETRLADVAEEFNRHDRRRLIIESQALEDFRISGVYSFADPDSLIRFLRNQTDLVVTESRNEIRIGQR